ncbi:MAG TPA: thioredoxin domain-containing protein [Solirubrobacteraceae bacterium]|nr:thioredoxin domain-containing protein [Solirubrobacteraceae bacterium]
MPAPRDAPPQGRSRLYRLGALVVTAVAVTAVLVAVLTSGSTSELTPGKTVPGQAQTLSLLAGIPQSGVSLGSPSAPVTLVEFGDLQCPACAQFATDTLPTVIARDVRSGKVLLQFRALGFIGSDSRRAAAMALALAQQNRLWQFVELAYHNQEAENSGYVTEKYLRALATAIPGADVPRALAARTSPAVSAQLAQASAQARAARIQATPSFELARAGAAPRAFHFPGLDSASFVAALAAALSGRAAPS